MVKRINDKSEIKLTKSSQISRNWYRVNIFKAEILNRNKKHTLYMLTHFTEQVDIKKKIFIELKIVTF